MAKFKKFVDGGAAGQSGGSDNDTLTLSLAVDVEDADEAQSWLYAYAFYHAKKNLKTLVNKNTDYGSVFIESAVEAMVDDEAAFDDVVTEILYRIKVRADDKDGRFGTQCFDDGHNYADEDVGETSFDCSNYWLLMGVVGEYGEEVVRQWVEESGEYELGDEFEYIDLYDADGNVVAENIFDD